MGFLLLVVLGGLFLLAVAFILVWQNNASPNTSSQPSDGESIPLPEISRVSLEDTKAAFDSGSGVFLDVRDANSYAAGHIPGALSFPLNNLPDRLSELNPQDWIITYCT